MAEGVGVGGWVGFVGELTFGLMGGCPFFFLFSEQSYANWVEWRCLYYICNSIGNLNSNNV